MPDAPTFSVVIATYNRWPFLAEAIDSVLAQTYSDFELIVVDDGSTDGTANHVAGRYPDIQLIVQENAERGAARNTGIVAAEGTWLTFLDSDDIYEPWHLEQASGATQAGSKAIASEALMWNPDTGATWKPPRIVEDQPLGLRRQLWGNAITLPALFVRRDLALDIGGFPEDRAFASSEDWLFNTFVLAEADVHQLPKPSVRVRSHSGRSTMDHMAFLETHWNAARNLLAEGLPSRPLNEEERTIVLSGAHRFEGVHRYANGEMRAARRALTEAWKLLGPVEGWKRCGRLWVQTLLGEQGAQALRRLRDKLAGR